MPHKTHAARVPSSAKTVVRSSTAAGGATLYTVPAGKTLVILAAWMAVIGTAAAGTVTGVLNVASEDDGSTNALVAASAATIGASPTSQGNGADSVSCEVRVAAGGTVVSVFTGTPPTVNCGFSGFLENA